MFFSPLEGREKCRKTFRLLEHNNNNIMILLLLLLIYSIYSFQIDTK